MQIGVLIIGDEILSGRRKDKHFDHVLKTLSNRGLRLSWVRFIGDELEPLIDVFRQTFANGDIVLSFGGIGATPDDNTRQAVASALNLTLQLHPEAEKSIRQGFSAEEVTPHRLALGHFPHGSSIIPNDYNPFPGFYIHQHFFMPGFPVMAWPMLDWILEHGGLPLTCIEDYIEKSVIVNKVTESKLIDLMQTLQQEYSVTVFSLPNIAGKDQIPDLELGIKGKTAQVEKAMLILKQTLQHRALDWRDMPDKN